MRLCKEISTASQPFLVTCARYSELLLICRNDTLTDQTEVQFIAPDVTSINMFTPFFVFLEVKL
jgi:hypothetical protein